MTTTSIYSAEKMNIVKLNVEEVTFCCHDKF